MTDDKRTPAAPDHKLIRSREDHEIEYWTKRLGVSPELLKRAIEAVDRQASAAELRRPGKPTLEPSRWQAA